ncbi:Aliphatic sulfonates import ATP-binding protein SsuB [Posidoniimonas polymericola]|uniref:Aliphatic sulfonates import ATP-binding protein SsuB n=1 Tax=Posidoniimonas polymericola TaxID=2528002 RepID=A0A5C5YAK5_9BACT|nr:ABC transporter ATP-binding protein [Posidoniimonas polymericola]TWT72717.1 Aliphatic sulfonates import ATP-binding protein SsuB [Posidoniimonas polymericola]
MTDSDPPEPLVQLQDVGVRYPTGTHALVGLSLDIQPGEFVSLLGPSGCGKSTVLRLVGGLTKATSGRVRRAWDGGPSQDAPVGCVFQEPTLLPWSTVWNNVYLPLRLQSQRRKSARQRVDEALALVGLTEFAKAYPRELSGGMKMRAALARALVTRPRLLMLDEPFAALDEITRFRLNDDLLRLWSEREMTALFVTHSVYESVYLSTRVLVLSERPGRVVDDITVDLPGPRDESVRSTSRYLELCARASDALHHAMGEAPTAKGAAS